MPERPSSDARRVALLRGINVGGFRTLRMEDLRRLASDLGLKGVRTIGASGNLLYSSRARPATDEARLTRALAARMGKATVLVRSAKELQRLVRAAPFSHANPRVPDKWRFIAFLAAPSDAPLPPIRPGVPVEYHGRGAREVFYTMSTPTREAIAMAPRLERALGTSVTVRNWNVVRALASQLSGEAPVPAARPEGAARN